MTIMVFLLTAFGAWSQKLTVESFGVAQGDLSASVNPRPDRNGVACGLVKVQLVGAGAKFEGNIMGNVSFQNNEYWVYMTEGAYLLNVSHPDCLPLSINLHDHGLKDGVQSKTTYRLVLVKPAINVAEQDDGLRFVALKLEPSEGAMVYIDGKPQRLVNGAANILLPMGRHTYRAEAQGYDAKSGSFDLGNETLPLNIRLESNLGSLRVSTPTAGAAIYVNDEHKGVSPWSGQLPAGTYRVEARLDGYRPQRQSVTLSQRASETITLPALQAIAGRLSVNYMPQDAEVWLDGKNIGKSPGVFRDITVGRHEVEIRKSGYVSKKKTITIAEGQTATLTGALVATQSNNSNSTSTATSTEMGSAVETFTVNGVSFKMVRVEGGTFMMGSKDSDAYSSEKPVHQVTLSSYAIGETEVTQELWQAVMGKNPSHFKGENLPVEQVSWEDCQEFIRQLNAKTGRTFRLPTEAEWEFAARGGVKSRGYKYCGSNSIGDVAWYWENSGNNPLSGEWDNDRINSNHCRTHPVKTKQANELGLYDMSGNVLEWCSDWYGSYGSNAQTNPIGPSSGSGRVIRGGSWCHAAEDCRSIDRDYCLPSYPCSNLGLRLAL